MWTECWKFWSLAFWALYSDNGVIWDWVVGVSNKIEEWKMEFSIDGCNDVVLNMSVENWRVNFVWKLAPKRFILNVIYPKFSGFPNKFLTAKRKRSYTFVFRFYLIEKEKKDVCLFWIFWFPIFPPAECCTQDINRNLPKAKIM